MRATARDHTALVRHLQDALDGASSGATKAWWERYLKGAIEFRGVGIPQIRSTLADWNTCDWFCVRVLGPTIATHGRACAKTISMWSQSPELWKARASVIGFVPVIAELDYHPLVLRSSTVLVRRDERFAKTAVGWILRELSRHDSGTVAAFVDEQLPHFSRESIRNALKYFPEAIQRKSLEDLKTARQQHAADGAARRR